MSICRAVLEQLNVDEEELVNLMDADVREIFTTMAGVEIAPGCEKIEAVQKFSECITAMVGFAGVYNGLISISVPNDLAKHIASQMLGMDVEGINEDVTDALGEIANITGGAFKHHFVKDGHEVRLSTPSVITGEEYVIAAGSSANTLTIRLQAGEESFLVSVYLEVGE